MSGTTGLTEGGRRHSHASTHLASEVRLIREPAQEEVGDTKGLAPGWLVSDLGQGRKRYEFHGTIDVMNTYIRILPDQDLTVVVQINFDAGLQIDDVLGGATDNLLGVVK